MENEEIEVVDTHENQQVEAEDQTTSEQETLTPEEIADLKHKADVSSQNYERAKKAEAEKKALEAKLASKNTQVEGLTAKDVLVLSGSGITNIEDVEFAEKWAKFNGKSIADTLEDITFKTILAQKNEERKTAQVTQTKGGPRGINKTSGEELLRKAARNEFPESDEDINKMLDAKFEAKRNALKR